MYLCSNTITQKPHLVILGPTGENLSGNGSYKGHYLAHVGRTLWAGGLWRNSVPPLGVERRLKAPRGGRNIK